MKFNIKFKFIKRFMQPGILLSMARYRIVTHYLGNADLKYFRTLTTVKKKVALSEKANLA